MVSQSLKRLKDTFEKATHRLADARDHEQQLGAALLKSQKEVNKLRGQIDKLRTERTDTRRKVDAMIKRFDKLGVDWGSA